MKVITLAKSIVALTTLSFMLTSCGKDLPQEAQTQTAVEELVKPGSNEGKIIPNQYIVMMKESAIAPGLSYIQGPLANRAEKSRFMKEKATVITNELNNFLIEQDINTTKVIAYYTAASAGFAITLTDEEYEKLSKNDKIDLLEHDREESLPDFVIESVSGSGGRAQTTPCGIGQAGGTASGNSNVWVWVVDSGIDLDHPDLNVNTANSRSFVGGSADDCNGHGTHVAGTIGAINNTSGVVGVSNGATVVSVRIFGCSGGSSSSTILSGLNYVASNDFSGDVVNMSLGGYYGNNCSSNSPYRSVLTAMGNAGTRVAIASGNSNANANLYSPACINATNVVTVASMTCSRTWSSFSNYGRGPCDYIATGSSVYSTYKNGGYATLSGTSMATPHVAGIMHLRNALPRTSGSVSNRGTSYPIARR